MRTWSLLTTTGLWLVLILAVSLPVGLVLTPVALIHPFRPQAPLGIAVAYEFRRIAPAVALGALLLAVPVLALLARRLRRAWQWLPLGLLATLAIASAWFARQNHFEWMFRPIADPAYAKAGDVTFVAGRDMVIAVEIAGDAVAYPVRQMAYHHLVNDVVGGRPLVSTY
jgi:hypothetical protein